MSNMFHLIYSEKSKPPAKWEIEPEMSIEEVMKEIGCESPILFMLNPDMLTQKPLHTILDLFGREWKKSWDSERLRDELEEVLKSLRRPTPSNSNVITSNAKEQSRRIDFLEDQLQKTIQRLEKLETLVSSWTEEECEEEECEEEECEEEECEEEEEECEEDEKSVDVNFRGLTTHLIFSRESSWDEFVKLVQRRCGVNGKDVYLTRGGRVLSEVPNDGDRVELNLRMRGGGKRGRVCDGEKEVKRFQIVEFHGRPRIGEHEDPRVIELLKKEKFDLKVWVESLSDSDLNEVSEIIDKTTYFNDYFLRSLSVKMEEFKKLEEVEKQILECKNWLYHKLKVSYESLTSSGGQYKINSKFSNLVKEEVGKRQTPRPQNTLPYDLDQLLQLQSILQQSQIPFSTSSSSSSSRPSWRQNSGDVDMTFV